MVNPPQNAALIGGEGGTEWSPGQGPLSDTADQLSSPPPGATSVNTCRVEFLGFAARSSVMSTQDPSLWTLGLGSVVLTLFFQV